MKQLSKCILLKECVASNHWIETMVKMVATLVVFLSFTGPTLAAGNKITKLTCADGEIAKSDGTGWICAEDLPALPVERFEGVLRICGNSDTPQWEPCSYSIGNTGPAGGIVFSVTNGGLHGLEAAPEDQSSAQWGCFSTEITGADGTVVGTGAQNTADILADCSDSPIAAQITNDYSLNGFNDWFLPSKDELMLLYQQRNVVGGFTINVYWSSSEDSSSSAWVLGFGSGVQGTGHKNLTFRVRAVRAF